MSREQAREEVNAGAARWVDRCKGIEYLKRDDRPRVNDESCRMGVRVSEANAAGQVWAQDLVKAWTPVKARTPALISHA